LIKIAIDNIENVIAITENIVFIALPWQQKYNLYMMIVNTIKNITKYK
jgi:hypothetical protein